MKKENVDHPEHYNKGNIEAIDVIEDWELNFHLGNALKYICRAQHKGAFEEDIEKAIWYLERGLDNFHDKKTPNEKLKEKYNLQLSHFVNQGEAQ